MALVPARPPGKETRPHGFPPHPAKQTEPSQASWVSTTRLWGHSLSLDARPPPGSCDARTTATRIRKRSTIRQTPPPPADGPPPSTPSALGHSRLPRNGHDRASRSSVVPLSKPTVLVRNEHPLLWTSRHAIVYPTQDGNPTRQMMRKLTARRGNLKSPPNFASPRSLSAEPVIRPPARLFSNAHFREQLLERLLEHRQRFSGQVGVIQGPRGMN